MAQTLTPAPTQERLPRYGYFTDNHTVQANTIAQQWKLDFSALPAAEVVDAPDSDEGRERASHRRRLLAQGVPLGKIEDFADF